MESPNGDTWNMCCCGVWVVVVVLSFLFCCVIFKNKKKRKQTPNTTCLPILQARLTLPFKFRKVHFRGGEREREKSILNKSNKEGPKVDAPHTHTHTHPFSIMGQNGSKKQSKAMLDEPNHHHHQATLNRSPSKSVVSSSSCRVDLGSSGRSRTRANSTVSLSTVGPSSMKRTVSPRTPRGREEEIYNIEQRIKKRLVMDNRKNQQQSSPSRLPKTTSNTSWVC